MATDIYGYNLCKIVRTFYRIKYVKELPFIVGSCARIDLSVVTFAGVPFKGMLDNTRFDERFCLCEHVL